MFYFVVSGLKFTGLLSPNATGIALDRSRRPIFLILDILIRFGDICDQIRYDTIE